MADELASIIVGFPLFLLVSWGIVRGVRRQPERLESSVRKWLTYIYCACDHGKRHDRRCSGISCVLGDLDTRFVLKIVTVLVIAGGVFGYYLDSPRCDRVSSAENRSCPAHSVRTGTKRRSRQRRYRRCYRGFT
jgi:hypothetical protein